MIQVNAWVGDFGLTTDTFLLKGHASIRPEDISLTVEMGFGEKKTVNIPILSTQCQEDTLYIQKI